MSKSNDKSSTQTDSSHTNRPYEPDPNLTPEENANKAREHKLKMVENEPGPQKLSYDDIQRGTGPGKNVDPGDGNPFNANPPVDPEILRMRREKLEDHESQQRVEMAEQQAETSRKQAEEQKQNRQQQEQDREKARQDGDGTDRTGATDRTVHSPNT